MYRYIPALSCPSVSVQATGFGGWPWPSESLAHDRHRQRFAQYSDGQVDERPMPEA